MRRRTVLDLLSVSDDDLPAKLLLPQRVLELCSRKISKDLVRAYLAGAKNGVRGSGWVLNEQVQANLLPTSVSCIIPFGRFSFR